MSDAKRLGDELMAALKAGDLKKSLELVGSDGVAKVMSDLNSKKIATLDLADLDMTVRDLIMIKFALHIQFQQLDFTASTPEIPLPPSARKLVELEAQRHERLINAIDKLGAKVYRGDG